MVPNPLHALPCGHRTLLADDLKGPFCPGIVRLARSKADDTVYHHYDPRSQRHLLYILALCVVCG